jgi:hypothetical protein
MPSSKIYLNVPYAEKDAAKAVGARWDAAAKKWYATANLDIGLFAKWHTADSQSGMSSRPVSAAPPPAAKNNGSGVFTYPESKDFIAYSGDEPPWD